MKLCRSCEINKPREMFTLSKRAKDGLQTYCKACYAARAAAHRLKNPDVIRETNRKSKQANKDGIAEYKRRYRANNPEKVKESRRASYAKNRESELSKARIYKENNKQDLAKRAADRLKDSPYLNRYYRSLRRATEKRARPIWFSPEKARDLYRQAKDLTDSTGEQWHVDHIVPLTSDLVCGLHWHGNMQVITGSENQSKSNRHWPDMPTESQNG